MFTQWALVACDIPENSGTIFGANRMWGNCATTYVSGWWFGTFLAFSHILGMSSSQLTFIFFRGVA